MAKITRSQAEQITNAYKEVCDISREYPDVNVSKSVKGEYYNLANVSYEYGDISIYLSLDDVTITIKYVSHCQIIGFTLSIGGSGGYIDIGIMDE